MESPLRNTCRRVISTSEPNLSSNAAGTSYRIAHGFQIPWRLLVPWRDVSFCIVFKRRVPVQYRTREATFGPWDEFGYEREAVERVLKMLSRAFGWPVGEGLRLRPEDLVWEIYWGYYPACTPPVPKWRRWIGSWPPDSLEMETLDRDLRRTVRPGKTVELHLSITVRDLADLVRG